MSDTIRVAVSGACGRMGREVVNTVLEGAPDFKLTGTADPAFAGKDICDELGVESDLKVEETIGMALSKSPADVVVIFSIPPAVMDDIRTCMKAKAVPVIGTTGVTPENLAEIKALSAEYGVGAIVAPNFAIGAILMMKMAKEAAKYLPAVEIIELHHDKKLDAPSGTSIKTAEMIAAARCEDWRPASDEPWPARGEVNSGINIHSVRLPGLIAHQEVIFGGLGQTLTIRHDSFDRKSFMPGVAVAIRKAFGLKDVIYGLENII